MFIGYQPKFTLVEMCKVIVRNPDFTQARDFCLLRGVWERHLFPGVPFAALGEDWSLRVPQGLDACKQKYTTYTYIHYSNDLLIQNKNTK